MTTPATDFDVDMPDIFLPDNGLEYLDILGNGEGPVGETNTDSITFGEIVGTEVGDSNDDVGADIGVVTAEIISASAESVDSADSICTGFESTIAEEIGDLF